ncbi:hypothetical protein MASR2M117_09400 [Paludibacter sp.]
MRYLISLLFLYLYCSLSVSAQQGTWILPPSDGAFGEFTEWQKISVAFTDGRSTSYEYRIALTKYKEKVCYYELQVKNTSSYKTRFRVKSTYFDRVENDSYSEKHDLRIKSNAIASFYLVARGCQSERNKKDIDDYKLCLSCGLRYEISILL